MDTPQAPDNEARRQAALNALNILDTAPEERYNCIVRLAAHLLDAPIALMVLVDGDRQWFKATHGLTIQETPRKISFCGHAILSEAPLLVPDALKDIRFSDNPLVTEEPRIRFYAGQPIKSTDGYPIGTLCVIDRQPREELSDLQLRSLRDLASLIETQIFDRQTASSNTVTSESNQQAIAEYEVLLNAGDSDSAKIVVDAQQNLGKFTPSAKQFFAFDEMDTGRPLKEIQTFLLYPLMETDLLNAIEYGESTTRIVQSISGKKLRARLTPFRPAASAEQSVVISLSDITASERAILLEHTLDGLDDEIVVIDQTGKIIFTNTAWDRVARENDYPMVLQASVGSNYLDLCRHNTGDRGYQEGVSALRELLAGRRSGFSSLYECTLARRKNIYLMTAEAFLFDGLSIVVSHRNITSILGHDVDIGTIKLDSLL